MTSDKIKKSYIIEKMSLLDLSKEYDDNLKNFVKYNVTLDSNFLSQVGGSIHKLKSKLKFLKREKAIQLTDELREKNA